MIILAYKYARIIILILTLIFLDFTGFYLVLLLQTSPILEKMRHIHQLKQNIKLSLVFW